MGLNGLDSGVSAEGALPGSSGLFRYRADPAAWRPATTNGDYASGVNYVEMKRYLHDQLLRDTDVFGIRPELTLETNVLDRAAATTLWTASERGHLHRSHAWSLAVPGARG